MSKHDSGSASSRVGLGWALASLLRDYQKQVEAALQGLPGGARAFLVMSHVQRQTCQSQIAIAERLGLDKTTLTYLLDALEQQDLIARSTDPHDRRSRRINLTEAGTTALAGYAGAVEAIEQEILARLGAEDAAAQFQQSLMKIAGFEHQSMDEAEKAEDSNHICQESLGLSADR